MNGKNTNSTEPHSGARLGLISVFGSTFFQLVGYFMLLPLLLLRLKGAEVSTTVAGLFAATGWLGVFLMTPFASVATQKMGRRPTLWLAATLPTVAALGFALTDTLWIWFLLELISGAASGLRWVLAEAVIAEFSPPEQRGRYVGIFETLVGTTFIIGPAVLVWVGADNPQAVWVVIAFTATGLLWSTLIPKLPAARDADTARVGIRGVWHALLAHPINMLAGFVAGFFESGVTSILPLYGLALGLSAATAALLVSASGFGSAVVMLPAGMLADQFSDPGKGRRTLMVAFAAITLIATCVIPLVAHITWLAWPIVFLWGGAGGSLYTLAMIDIGTREQGITLVNSTAVLVLTYTLGGLVASATSGALIQWSPTWGFPALLLTVASVGLLALVRTRQMSNI